MDNSEITLVGYRYKLLRPMLGNDSGAIGFVFDQYEDFDNPDAFGVQIIFPNGNYDGFSYKEQQEFLESLGYDFRYLTYKFENVMKVSMDYRNKYWDFSGRGSVLDYVPFKLISMEHFGAFDEQAIINSYKVYLAEMSGNEEDLEKANIQIMTTSEYRFLNRFN